MKYSTSYLSHNLLSQKLAQQLQLEMKAILSEYPDLMNQPLTEVSGVEHYVTYSNCFEMLETIKEAKDFVLESDIAEHFYEKKHIKQDFKISMKSPFKRIMITFEDPIPIKMAIPKNQEEFMNVSYDKWIRMITGDPDHNLVEIDDRLHGIMIIWDEDYTKEKIQKTLESQKEQKTMSENFKEYYEKMNPKTTFKINFITDANRTKRDFENHPDRYDEKEKEFYEKQLASGFEYSNIIFDSTLLPEFISEFEISKMKLYEKPINKVANALQKLLNLTINLINFINSNDTVEYAPIYRSMKQQKKYLQQTGKNLPPLFYLLKVKYPKEYILGGAKGQPHSEYRYQFDVRGHFKHLVSAKWTHKRGQIIWVQPFRKGKGKIYIPKNYVVDSPQKVVDDYKWDEKTGEK